MRPSRLLKPFLLFASLSLFSVFAAEPFQSNRIAYKPLQAEGYLQAWKYNIRGNGIRLYLTYIISNQGPGSFNHGLSLVMYHNGKSTVRMIELAEDELYSRAGVFEYKSDAGEFRMRDGGIHLAFFGEPTIYMDLQKPYGLIDLSRGGIQPGPGNTLNAMIPVVYSSVIGNIIIDGKDHPFEAIGGMEYLSTNHSVHTYAKRFQVLRSYSLKEGIFLGGFYSTNKPNTLNLQIEKNGRTVLTDSVSFYKELQTEKNAFSGYTVPTEMLFTTKKGCIVHYLGGRFSLGLNILQNVSAMLRLFIRTFFAKPYILHYDGQVKVWCDYDNNSEAYQAKKPADYTSPVENTFYMINE